MLEVKTNDYEIFLCMVDQKIANHLGYSDQPVVAVTYITHVFECSQGYWPRMVYFNAGSYKMVQSIANVEEVKDVSKG